MKNIYKITLEYSTEGEMNQTILRKYLKEPIKLFLTSISNRKEGLLQEDGLILRTEKLDQIEHSDIIINEY